MNILLQGLLIDLRQRCLRFRREIEKLDRVPDEIQDYKESIAYYMVPFNEQPLNPVEMNITLLLNQAWQQFHQSSDSFSDWETQCG